MRILCWNIRGIGGGCKIGAVRKMICQNKVGFMGLVETKKARSSVQEICRLWGSDDVKWEEVEAQGRSGGIICMWDGNFLRGGRVIKRDRWICIMGFLQEVQMEICIGVVYGLYDAQDKRRIWQELIEVKENVEVPMMMMGDFNEIRYPHERKGCEEYSRSMRDFEN